MIGTNIYMKKLILIFFLSLTGCSNSINSDTVSLLDYTTPTELSKLGYTPNRIDEVNRTIESYFGYNRYDGYQKYKINNFDVIANPNDPDELYIVKNGDFLIGMKQPNTVKLYKQETRFPNPADTSIYFDRSKPFVVVADDNQFYYDINLDSSDVVYRKKIYQGAERYMNYVDLLPLPDYEEVIEANIPNQQCQKVAGPFACCLKEDQTYQPYDFTYETGWVISSDNEIAQRKCNTEE